jgi:hypothetical protein
MVNSGATQKGLSNLKAIDSCNLENWDGHFPVSLTHDVYSDSGILAGTNSSATTESDQIFFSSLSPNAEAGLFPFSKADINIIS